MCAPTPPGRSGQAAGFYRLTGHKWFMSAPMSDAFLVLAQAQEGLSCFLVPRLIGEGESNGFRFQRLKDKLGNRSNASSEVEFVGRHRRDGRRARRRRQDHHGHGDADPARLRGGLVGDRCAPGWPRPSTTPAIARCSARPLIDQPLMQRVLADMALDVAAATALSFRLARSFDEAAADRGEAAFARAMTPVVKYWVCKIAPSVLYEAMECLGGNGYVEEAPLARYYREAPVNAIWEGSGNVMALDVLRVLARAPSLFDDVLAGIEADLGAGRRRHHQRAAGRHAGGEPPTRARRAS